MSEIELNEILRKRRLGSLLGLARKAGKVIAGTERVREEIRSGGNPGKICLVLLAADSSANTRKRVVNCCSYYHKACLVCDLDTDSMGTAIGKAGSISAVGITDQGLAEALARLINAPANQGKE
ncbi:MAG: ribosomal L7Ae/L30e/S12e/Gadd45 family protein [Clostridia bacterium]|nr:ribosomal L7Ae/L30e/S12e/Gadd45 family protein [Clostridia bacterium]MBQ4290700.1 ribosomal L7Ae/L30e/S12e/Gadd45 family protein [Clostridia bacterium]